MMKSITKRLSRLIDKRTLDKPGYKVSSLLNKDDIDVVQSITNEMQSFHPDMKSMLEGNEGVRKWEYGMMLYCLPSFQDKSVLDIGSGPSLLPLFLAKTQGAQVTVLDLPQPYTIEFEQMTLRFQADNVTIKVGDMRGMPFEDGVFDYVISISVIEHLSHSADHTIFIPEDIFVKETKQTLNEMYRVLRPGGWIYLTSDAYIPGKVKQDVWAGKLLDGNPYGAYPIEELTDIFVTTFSESGASFPFPIRFEKSLLLSSSRYSSYRNRYMTVFNLFVQKPIQTP